MISSDSPATAGSSTRRGCGMSTTHSRAIRPGSDVSSTTRSARRTASRTLCVTKTVLTVSHGVATPPLMEWAQGRADHDHCAATPSQTSIGTDVIRFSWTGCAQHADVTHYRIIGAGHTWPGELVDSGPGSATQTIKATQVIWDFFNAHPLTARLFN